MTSENKEKYHHGALREALLAAAEAELEAHGVEGFSLRKVAKRAGVSHAAPAHHFGDAQGLLTALAALGYRRFVETQMRHEAQAGDDARARLLASGHGYIDFAETSPALFRLVFSSTRPDYEDPELVAAAEAAFGHLAGHVAAIRGISPFEDAGVMLDAIAIWSAAHGLADLLNSGRVKPLQSMARAERDAAVSAILSRMLPRPD